MAYRWPIGAAVAALVVLLAALAVTLHSNESNLLLSATLGDHMVLQRAPFQATVWGHTKSGAVVTTTFDSQTFESTAGADGVWRQVLPAMHGSTKSYTLKFRSSSGESAELKDVLFGDVYICGGQSNMEWPLSQCDNATHEMELSERYPHIRIFIVGEGTASDTPLDDLRTVLQSWSKTDRHSIARFSAVCWFFAKQIADALPGGSELPIGLIHSNWGGTPIQRWAPPEALRECGTETGHTDLYNAMIHPFTIGPMALSGFTWYQGEANFAEAAMYKCWFPTMIRAWRRAFNSPTAYFGFVQLSTWCEDGLAIAGIRDAQLSALQLQGVGYATNADHGRGCDVHPHDKQFCGKRLGNSAVAVRYGEPVAWRSPTFASGSVAISGRTIHVEVALNDVGNDGLVLLEHPFNAVDGLDCAEKQASHRCAWAEIEVLPTAGGVLKASVALARDSQRLVFSADAPFPVDPGASVVLRYGYGAIPMLTAYDRATDLPVLPFQVRLSGSGASRGDAAEPVLAQITGQAEERWI